MLVKRAGWMVLGNGFYSLFQLINLIVISKTLGMASLGAFSLALALTAPIMLFSNFGMRILWNINEVGAANFNQFRIVRLILSIVGGSVTCIWVFLYSTESEYLVVFALVVFSKVVENNADIFYAKAHRDGKQKIISVSMVVRGAVGALGMFIGCKYYGSLVMGVTFYSLFWLFAHIFIDQIREPIKKDDLLSFGNYLSISKDVVIRGSPIATGLLLANLNMNIPRLQLEREFDLEIVGIYSALFFFIQTGSVIVTSISQVILAKLSDLYDNNDNQAHLLLLSKVFIALIAYAFGAATLIYVFGDFLLSLLFSGTVASYSITLCIFLLLSPAQYSISIFNAALASVKRSDVVMGCQLAMFFIIILLSYVLIPRYDVLGAYLTYSIACGIISTIYVFLYMQFLKVNR